jgi:hypothetical protein
MAHQNAGSGRKGVFRKIVHWLARPWRGGTATVTRRYRPEDHYMRGPGPKTRQKQSRGNGSHADPLTQ